MHFIGKQELIGHRAASGSRLDPRDAGQARVFLECRCGPSSASLRALAVRLVPLKQTRHLMNDALSSLFTQTCHDMSFCTHFLPIPSFINQMCRDVSFFVHNFCQTSVLIYGHIRITGEYAFCRFGATLP